MPGILFLGHAERTAAGVHWEDTTHITLFFGRTLLIVTSSVQAAALGCSGLCCRPLRYKKVLHAVLFFELTPPQNPVV